MGAMPPVKTRCSVAGQRIVRSGCRSPSRDDRMGARKWVIGPFGVRAVRLSAVISFEPLPSLAQRFALISPRTGGVVVLYVVRVVARFC